MNSNLTETEKKTRKMTHGALNAGVWPILNFVMKILPCLILSDVWASENAAKLMTDLKIEWNNLATVNDCDVFPTKKQPKTDQLP